MEEEDEQEDDEEGEQEEQEEVEKEDDGENEYKEGRPRVRQCRTWTYVFNGWPSASRRL